MVFKPYPQGVALQLASQKGGKSALLFAGKRFWAGDSSVT
jgi:hypothetical protein